MKSKKSVMETTNFLAEFYDIESFNFSKPKKYKKTDFMVSKIKNKNKDPVLIQFPKMKIKTLDETKMVFDMEFVNETGYTKKVVSFLSKLDTFIVDYIVTHSEAWFDKSIPLENVKGMYKKDDFVRFVYDKAKSQVVDKKNEIQSVSELQTDVTVECIAQLKYIVFTKDTCFFHWEICTAKLYKQLLRVPKFGFVEDTLDNSDNELSDEENIVTFF